MALSASRMQESMSRRASEYFLSDTRPFLAWELEVPAALLVPLLPAARG